MADHTVLTEVEALRVLEAMSGGMALRNRGLFAMGVSVGGGWCTHFANLLSLNIENVQMIKGRLRDSYQLDGLRKHYYMTPQAAWVISAWLAESRARYSAQRTWPLFHTASGRRLRPSDVERTMRRAMKTAGIEDARIGPPGRLNLITVENRVMEEVIMAAWARIGALKPQLPVTSRDSGR